MSKEEVASVDQEPYMSVYVDCPKYAKSDRKGQLH